MQSQRQKKFISWQRSITGRLSIVSALVVFVAIIGVGAVLIGSASEVRRSMVFQFQQKNAEKVSGLIYGYLTYAIEDLGLFSNLGLSDMISEKEQIKALENLLISRQSRYNHIAMVDRSGREIFKVSRFHTYLPHEMKQMAGSRAFSAALEGRTHIGHIYIAPDSGLLSLEVALPAGTRKNANVIISEVNVTNLWQDVSQIKIGDTGYAYLVDDRGRFIAYQDSSRVLQRYGADMSMMPPVADFIAGKTEKSLHAYEYKGINGDAVIGVYSPIRGSGWAVVVELPEREAYAPITRMMWYLAGLAFLGALSAGTIAFFIFRRLSKPIRELTDNVERIGRGDLNARLAEINRQDEVGVLSRAFRHMQDELRSLYGNLERQVEELKDAQERLKTSEEKYRELVQYANSIILRWDMKGRITFLNEYGRKLFGYSEEEIIGRHVIGTIVDEKESTGRDLRVMIENIIGRPEDYEYNENENVCSNGRRVWVAWSNRSIIDAEGRLCEILSVGTDITERKHAQEERDALQVQLFRVQKMEAIGTLAGGIAHNFNNILMGIEGYTSLMMMTMEPSNPHYARHKLIQEQVRSGSRLTQQLLGFARGGKYEVKQTDINNLIERTAALFSKTAKDIIILKRYIEPVWIVDVDQVQMEQVLLNLFINTAQAMPGGGSVSVETENVTLSEAETKSHEALPGRYVRISVTDTGMGMDARTMERIFDPFFTTKDTGRGTGLGLPSAYGIVRNHGGFITVDSAPGRGSTFKIYLSVTEKERRPVAGGGPVAPLKGTETIMIVDDEKTVLDVTKELLENLGYKVYAVEGGQDAVDGYREKYAHIDMVILDVIMPGMSGEKTYDALKEINPGVKVMLSSGYTIDGQAQQIMDKGCRGFIQKPYDINELTLKIRKIIEDRR